MTAWSRARHRRTRAVVGVFAGCAMVRLAAVDGIARHASLRSYVFVAGAAVTVLAAAALLDEVRRSRAVPAVPWSRTCARPRLRHASAMAAWLLPIPLAAALAVAPTGAKARTVGLGHVTPSRVYVMAYPRLPAGDPVRMSVMDYVTRLHSDTGGSLIGRQVQITGYLGSAPDGHWDLRRTVSSCCSPRPLTFVVRLLGQVPAGVTPGTWLRVIGGRPAGDGSVSRPTRIAYLSITSATVIPEPADPAH
jgi:hypothetical protein